MTPKEIGRTGVFQTGKTNSSSVKSANSVAQPARQSFGIGRANHVDTGLDMIEPNGLLTHTVVHLAVPHPEPVNHLRVVRSRCLVA